MTNAIILIITLSILKALSLSQLQYSEAILIHKSYNLSSDSIQLTLKLQLLQTNSSKQLLVYDGKYLQFYFHDPKAHKYDCKQKAQVKINNKGINSMQINKQSSQIRWFFIDYDKNPQEYLILTTPINYNTVDVANSYRLYSYGSMYFSKDGKYFTLHSNDYLKPFSLFKMEENSITKKQRITQDPTLKSRTEIFINNKNAFIAISYLQINSDPSVLVNHFDVNNLYIQEYFFNEATDTFEQNTTLRSQIDCFQNMKYTVSDTQVNSRFIGQNDELLVLYNSKWEIILLKKQDELWVEKQRIMKGSNIFSQNGEYFVFAESSTFQIFEFNYNSTRFSRVSTVNHQFFHSNNVLISNDGQIFIYTEQRVFYQYPIPFNLGNDDQKYNKAIYNKSEPKEITPFKKQHITSSANSSINAEDMADYGLYYLAVGGSLCLISICLIVITVSIVRRPPNKNAKNTIFQDQSIVYSSKKQSKKHVQSLEIIRKQ